VSRLAAMSGFLKQLAQDRLRLAAGCALTSALAACSPAGGGHPVDASIPNLQAAPTTPVQEEPLAPSSGPAGAPGPPGSIGGGARVGLILPLTQNGAPNPAGVSLRNAAQLALDEAADKNVALMVEDDQSTADGAATAARAALAQNVGLVVGPLFSPSVAQASAATRAAGVPMIAFSTDAGIASRNVFLLSFLVETYVDGVVDYAVGHGKKSFAAVVPDSDYGRAAEAEFLQETARLGATVRDDEHYSSGGAATAIRKVAANGASVDALFIPEQVGAMPAVASALTAAGLTGNRVLILGTGLWNDPRVLGLPALQGAVFAAPDPSGFASFAANYRAKFGSDPLRIATLAHDAIALASALARKGDAQPFSTANLTNASGFNGVDGIFRFRPNGLNQRGLAIDQIRDRAAVTLIPAPHSFEPNSQG
jgi:branched-chain amino acid transport system substrate-binding protein